MAGPVSFPGWSVGLVVFHPCSHFPHRGLPFFLVFFPIRVIDLFRSLVLDGMLAVLFLRDCVSYAPVILQVGGGRPCGWFGWVCWVFFLLCLNVCFWAGGPHLFLTFLLSFLTHSVFLPFQVSGVFSGWYSALQCSSYDLSVLLVPDRFSTYCRCPIICQSF